MKINYKSSDIKVFSVGRHILIKAVAADELAAAPGTNFLVAVRVMRAARRDVTVGTTEPFWKLKFSRIVENNLQYRPVRIFDMASPNA